MYKFTIVFFIFTIIILKVNADFENNQLVLIQILFRHGDRSPVKGFKTNPVNESEWPQGFGELTQIGMQQHYELGSFFRDKYVDKYKLLSPNYNRYEVAIRSTDYDRTLMSAYSNLAGLYPPEGEQVWNPSIAWQPVPVHTIDLKTDHLLYMENECPQYDKIYKQELRSKEIKREEVENKEFYEFIRSATQQTDITIDTIWNIYDPINCQLRHNKKVPSWTFNKYKNGTMFDKLYQLNSLKFEIQYNRPGEARLKGGVLLKEMLSNMNKKVSSSTDDQKKAFFYSAHDTTVAAFLCALGVFNHLSPPYASAVMLELWRFDPALDNQLDNYFVKAFYKNSSKNFQLNIPGCGPICSLDKFIASTKDNIPVDWHAECNFPRDEYFDYCFILIILLVLSTIILVSFIAYIYQQKRPKGYISVSYDENDSYK